MPTVRNRGHFFGSAWRLEPRACLENSEGGATSVMIPTLPQFLTEYLLVRWATPSRHVQA
jgi:hypothetical protein